MKQQTANSDLEESALIYSALFAAFGREPSKDLIDRAYMVNIDGHFVLKIKPAQSSEKDQKDTNNNGR